MSSTEDRLEKEGRKTRKKAIVRVHPLFLLLGVYYSFTGELFSFFLSAVVALQHECAHAFAAAKRGYVLNKMVLMPYGAVIDADFSDVSFADEVAVALAGPLANFLTAIGFVALWWLFPATYPYTDGAFYASLSVALVNLLPAYPLDGGRIFCACLRRKYGENKARKIGKAVACFFASLFAAAFFAFVFRGKLNLSLGIFAVFLLAGGFGNGKEDPAAYEKLRYSFEESLKRGAEVKRVAVSETCTLRRALSFTEKGKYLVLDVYDGQEKKAGEIGQNELAALFEQSAPFDRLGDLLRKKAENSVFR